MVPKAQIQAFEQEMKQAGVNYKVVTFPNAKHSFTNPAATALGKKFNLPMAYDKDADSKSWNEMKAFFAKSFANKKSM